MLRGGSRLDSRLTRGDRAREKKKDKFLFDGVLSDLEKNESEPSSGVLSPGEKKYKGEKRTAAAALSSPSTRGRLSSVGKTKVLRSRAKSQWIAVWWLLYQVQHPGRYLSRLQTDWLTHDIASVSKVRQRDPSMTMNGHGSGGVH